MTEDHNPPSPLPPAAQAPYPAHPAPHPRPVAEETPAEPAPVAAPAAIGPLGLTLIGGAVAVAVGLLMVPLFRKKPQPAPKRAARRAPGTTRRKRSED